MSRASRLGGAARHAAAAVASRQMSSVGSARRRGRTAARPRHVATERLEGRLLFTNAQLNAAGVYATQAEATGGVPVNLADGSIAVDADDLATDGFGTGWGVSRSWTNNAAFRSTSTRQVGATFGVGKGWFVDQQPTISSVIGCSADATASTSLLIVNQGDVQEAFAGGSGAASYAPTLDGQDTLTYSSSARQYTLADAAGDRTVFWGSSGPSVGAAGTLVSYTSASGATVTVTNDPSTEQIAQEQRTETSC